jgi:hypothetical protein
VLLWLGGSKSGPVTFSITAPGTKNRSAGGGDPFSLRKERSPAVWESRKSGSGQIPRMRPQSKNPDPSFLPRSQAPLGTAFPPSSASRQLRAQDRENDPLADKPPAPPEAFPSLFAGLTKCGKFFEILCNLREPRSSAGRLEAVGDIVAMRPACNKAEGAVHLDGVVFFCLVSLSDCGSDRRRSCDASEF